MKNLLKLFGISAMVAVIGFGFAACGPGAGGDDNGGNNGGGTTTAPDVTFTVADGTAGDNKITVTLSTGEWNEAALFYLEDVLDYDYPDDNTNIHLRLSLKPTILADKKTVEIAFIGGNGFSFKIDFPEWNEHSILCQCAAWIAATNLWTEANWVYLNDSNIAQYPDLREEWEENHLKITFVQFYTGKLSLVASPIDLTMPE